MSGEQATVNSTELMTGQRVGKVQLGKMVGEGACGVVYLGHHTTLQIDVAVKILKSNQFEKNDQVYRERFRREAQLAARLEHPNLVRTLDFGVHKGMPYLVMDYVDGYSLRDFLAKQDKPVSERTILKVILAVCNALNHAHGACIVHRDLKPSNILISRKGQLKITDLGLARQQGMANLTHERVAVGTPAYMAPESIAPGGETDHRSDLYSLGVIAYRLAFGKRPYDGDLQQIIHGHLGGLAKFDGPNDCSPETIAMIRKMMATKKANRFQSAAEITRYVRGPLREKLRREAPLKEEALEETKKTSSSTGITRTSEFKGIVSLLDGRFEESATEHKEGKIVHTTSSERFFVWAVLVLFCAVAAIGWFFFG
ncbi:Hypothetical protein PBC10988_14010 [Planctomycetales bacterium 10988]|nr:Hypothetical protein PBC10988_14010 [Planctomycetales bacterium 10988]